MNAALFVYGTLKVGYGNHDRYCRGVKSVQPAEVWGRLYSLPYGYPMLVIPPETVLCWGANDRAFDAAQTSRLAESTTPGLDPSDIPGPVGDWERIQGEVLIFDDLEQRFERLDELEDYRPQASGLYDRAVVWTLAPQSQPAWVYVAPHGVLPAGAVRAHRRWP